MSKCYVIKNKEGKYLSGYSENESWFEAKDFETNKLTEACLFEDENCEYINLEENEKIVPITISEGDLEEKYEVLKGVIHFAMDYACKDKKLYKRIQDFNASTNRHNGDNNVYLEDAVCFLTKLSKDARDDAKKWGEFFEKVYQEQQAKESEKDD